MIDLHLHLDGSLSIEDFKHLASRQGLDLGSDFPNNIYVDENCRSLEEYLERFDLPLMLLQDSYSIEYVMKSLINRLYELGYIYSEIRFAPQLHTSKGLSQEDAVKAAINGLKEALKDKQFNAKIILCCMRQAEYETNLPTILLAEKYALDGVAGVDLAGPEAFHSADYYTSLFDEAKKRNVHITIHAGEACGSDEIIKAIKLLGAERIGHGVHLELNDENVDLILKNNISFEFCPTSNLQTTSLSSYKDVPLKEFINKGIRVTINSDNMSVSDTDVIDEFIHLIDAFDLSKDDILNLLNNSIEASFTSDKEKQALKDELVDGFDRFYSLISI